jgi:predicted TIM-barrel fold metal-dependent hydrolase
LPFMLDRIYPIAANWPGSELRSRSLREVWDSNIWVTTSGMFSMAAMSCLLQTTRTDRILYSVDYPLASNKRGLQFMEALQQSGLVTDEEFEGIAYRNAAKLLKLTVAG